MTSLPFNDPVIASVANKSSLTTLKQTSNLFVDLVEDIVAQQLSGKVAEVIFKRFCNLFPNSIPTPDILKSISTEELRSVGLSNAKANYVRNIAEYALANDLSVEYISSLNDVDIINELTKIKGVGVWTAQMVLIFSLNRPDVFPIEDLAIRQGMQKLYGLTLEGKELRTKLESIANNWRPYRTIGTRYVWLYVNLKRSNAVRL
jgi:DNA-3-methyladenine glycosylase II